MARRGRPDPGRGSETALEAAAYRQADLAAAESGARLRGRLHGGEGLCAGSAAAAQGGVRDVDAPARAVGKRTSARRWWRSAEWSRRRIFLCVDLPHSDDSFVMAFPAETTKAFLEGHRQAFEYFGGVPRTILYDNTRIAVAEIAGAGELRPTGTFSGLESHYLFAAKFGPPGNGCWRNAAGGVGRGSAARRETIGARFERDREKLLPLPPLPYESLRAAQHASQQPCSGAVPDNARPPASQGCAPAAPKIAKTSPHQTPPRVVPFCSTRWDIFSPPLTAGHHIGVFCQATHREQG